MRRSVAMAAAALATTLAAAGAQAAVKVERVTYHKWPGAYRLTNGTVDLVVVPQIGRVMRYGFVGGPNVLWENQALWGMTVYPAKAKDWTNFGGDKLWPAPQSRWNWPPDPHLDAGALTVSILPGPRLALIGQASPKTHLRFRREISLATSGTEVTFRNTLENVGAKAVQWSVWQITQVDDPDEARLAVNHRGGFTAGVFVFPDSVPLPEQWTTGSGIATIHRHPLHSAKIGSDSPQGWACALKGGTTFTVSARYERGKEYPDNGCGQEIYTNPNPLKYVELELLGPIRALAPRARTTLTTHWKLERQAR